MIGDGFLRQQLKRLENCAQRDDGRLVMKHLLLTTIGAVLLVGCEWFAIIWPTSDLCF